MCVCVSVCLCGKNGRNNCFAVLMKQIAVERKKNSIMSHHFLSTGNSYTSSIDEDTATNIYDSSEEIEETTTSEIITTSPTISSTTEEDYPEIYPDHDQEPDQEKSEEEEGDFSTIVSSTETPTTSSSTTVPLTTTSTTEKISTTTSIFEGSGTSNYYMNFYTRSSPNSEFCLTHKEFS